MTKQEFMQIAGALKTYYPKDSLLPNEQAVALWYDLLKDLEYRETVAAIKKWVMNNKWPPTIAEIREAVKTQRQTAEIENFTRLCLRAGQQISENSPRQIAERK